MDYEKQRKEIGKRIKMLREKRGESQAVLGRIICVSQNSISKIENGDVSLTLENQLRIAEHYNVSHDYLCRGIEGDAVLDILMKYISLRYKTISFTEELFKYPVLEISNTLFEYLVHYAHMQCDSYMPEAIRDKWMEFEKSNFYERDTNNAFQQYVSVVPLTENLICSKNHDEEKKQSDLLRELTKQLINDFVNTIDE